MAESKIKGHTPTELSSSEYTFTPASGYEWPVVQIIELQPDVFYVHLNVYGNYAKNSMTEVGEMRIRGRTPYPNQLIGKIMHGNITNTASGQWLSTAGVRVIYDSGDALTNVQVNLDGVVVLH